MTNSEDKQKLDVFECFTLINITSGTGRAVSPVCLSVSGQQRLILITFDLDIWHAGSS